MTVTFDTINYYGILKYMQGYLFFLVLRYAPSSILYINHTINKERQNMKYSKFLATYFSHYN
jgi:hypothetical protein